MANEAARTALGSADIGIIDKKKSNLLTQLEKWLNDAETSISETKWRTESDEDYKFYAGDQDTEEVKNELTAQKRPTTVYNEVKPKIDVLIGMGAQMRRVPIVVPVGTEDEALAELVNSTFKFYRYNLKLNRVEFECFEHTVKSGRSFQHFYINDENPFEPEIKSCRFNGRDVILDPDSVEYDLSDAKYIFVSKWLDEDDIKLYWPDFDPELIKSLSQSAIATAMPSYFNEAKNKYRVVECWYRKLETVYWFQNPISMKPEMLKEEDWKKFIKVLKDGLDLPDGKRLQMDEPPQSIERKKKFIYYAHFSGNQLLDEGQSPYRHDMFPYILYGAYKNEDENRWFSATTMMKDPQRGTNTMRRQLVHLLQTSPKGIMVHEVGAILDIDQYDKRSSEPNYHMEVAQGAIDKTKFTNQPQISPIYGQLDGIFVQSMKDASGVQDPLMGTHTTSREPGVTMRIKQESNVAVLYILFDNYRESRMAAGKQLLSLIQQYVSMPKLMRIAGPEGQQQFQVNTQMNPQVAGFNDITVGKYDLWMDEAVDTLTMRLAVAEILTTFAQNNPGSIPPELIMEYLDLPFTAKQKVQAYTQQSQQAQQDAQNKEYELKTRELDVKEAEAVAKIDLGKAKMLADMIIKREERERKAEVEAEKAAKIAQGGQ